MDNDSSIKGALKWTTSAEVVAKIISPITTMVLARLLDPSAFGVVATVNMVISLAEVFSDAGFQKYIVQRQFSDEKKEDMSICVAFWTNMAITVFAFLLIVINNATIADAVGSSGYGLVLIVASLSLPITAFSSIQKAILKKLFLFKPLSVVRMVTKFVPFLVTVPLAFLGFSFWAIIIGNLIGGLAEAVILAILSPWNPKWQYSFALLKEMAQFCIWTFLEAISSWCITNIGVLFITIAFSSYFVGVYKVALTTVDQIISIVSVSTVSVLYSSLSLLQNDDTKFVNTIQKFQRVVGYITIPLGVGFLVFRDWVTLIFLGDQWADSTLLIGLWGFVASESIIFGTFCGTALMAKGKPHFQVVSNSIQLVLLAIAFGAGSYIHDFTVIVVLSTVARVQVPITGVILLKKVSGYKLSVLMSQIWQPIVAACAMGTVAVLLLRFSSSLLWGAESMCLCVAVYLGIMILIPSSRGQLFALLKSKISDRFVAGGK